MARDRWQKAIEWAKEEARRLREEARDAAETEGEEDEGGATRRASARLHNARKDYNESRAYRKRTEEEKKEAEKKARRAVAAKHSARIGVRLWWWMVEGEGYEARGPMSVRRGRRGAPTTGMEEGIT